MSLSGYKKERFSSTKTNLLCTYAFVGFDAQLGGGDGGAAFTKQEAGEVKNEAFSSSSYVQNPSCLINLYPPQSFKEPLEMTDNGKQVIQK